MISKIFKRLICKKCLARIIKKSVNKNCNIHGCFQIKKNKIFYSDHQINNFFDYHWKTYRNLKIPRMKLNQANKFLEFIFKNHNKKSICVDVGCGDGVHLKALSSVNKFFTLIGIDISSRALNKAKKLKLPNTLFIRTSSDKIPLNECSADFTFSFGLLPYLSNVENSISEMIRITKKGGVVGLWTPEVDYSNVCVNILRFFMLLFPLGIRTLVSNFFVPLLIFMPTKSQMNIFNSSWKQCREVVMVNLGSEKLKFLNKKIILNYFKKYNCQILLDDNKNPITIWAKKLS